MKNQIYKSVSYDSTLQIEIQSFVGIEQTFPRHFHNYYVIGLIESGQRQLICNNKEYIIKSGEVVIFNPNDSHACSKNGDESFIWKSMNISKDTMNRFAGTEKNPVFYKNIIKDEEIFFSLLTLHNMIGTNSDLFYQDFLHNQSSRKADLLYATGLLLPLCSLL